MAQPNRKSFIMTVLDMIGKYLEWAHIHLEGGATRRQHWLGDTQVNEHQQHALNALDWWKCRKDNWGSHFGRLVLPTLDSLIKAIGNPASLETQDLRLMSQNLKTDCDGALVLALRLELKTFQLNERNNSLYQMYGEQGVLGNTAFEAVRRLLRHASDVPVDTEAEMVQLAYLWAKALSDLIPEFLFLDHPENMYKPTGQLQQAIMDAGTWLDQSVKETLGELFLTLRTDKLSVPQKARLAKLIAPTDAIAGSWANILGELKKAHDYAMDVEPATKAA